ncbi:MAG: hypothetical protein CSA81_04370 [Acidobacteria bacterium]|nr:MAG: hypothetical protein CSA81_04370 [Acidobacteriota bacterium]
MTYPTIRIKAKSGKYEEVPLTKDEITVGRSATCDVVIDDASVSRIHFRLIKQGLDYMIVDNNSSNGTYLQKRKILQEILQDGDDIFAGRVHIYFSNKNKAAVQMSSGMETVDLHTDALRKTTAYQAVASSIHPSCQESVPPGEMPLKYPPSNDTSSAAVSASNEPPNPVPHTAPPPVQSEESVTLPTPPSVSVPPPAAPDAPVQPQMPYNPPQAPSYNQQTEPPSFEQASFGFQDDTEGFASPIHRLLAVIIDGVIGTLLMLPVILLPFIGVNNSTIILGLSSVISILLALHLIIGWLKFGKTLGKHFLGLRIVMIDEPHRAGLSFKTFILRLVGYLISGILLYLPFITILTDSEGRGMHDKMAGTKVVKKD